MTPEQELLLKQTNAMVYALAFGIDMAGQFRLPGFNTDYVNVPNGQLKAIEAAVGKPAPVALTDADLDALAQKVAALLAPVVSSPGAVADEIDRRERQRLGNG